MGAEEHVEEQAPAGKGTGATLRRAREAAGLSLADLAERTRIRERHLQALEDGNLAALPGRTYVIGFARTYARELGLDDAALVQAIRVEYAGSQPEPELPSTPAFVPGDPARVPSSGFAWVAGFAVVFLGVAGFAYWRLNYGPDVELPSLLPSPTPVASAPPVVPSAPAPVASTPAPNGPVVFTALADGVWVKFYDGAGKQLLQKQMGEGETFTVPAEAQNPMVWTGQPDQLAITIGGQPVPKISDARKRVKDVPISAAALLARGAAGTATSAAPAAGQPAAPNAAAQVAATGSATTP